MPLVWEPHLITTGLSQSQLVQAVTCHLSHSVRQVKGKIGGGMGRWKRLWPGGLWLLSEEFRPNSIDIL